MSVQYLSNENGQITAVQLLIEDWERINSKYPGIEQIGNHLPLWYKEIIDTRLMDIENNPDKIRPISELMHDLDQ